MQPLRTLQCSGVKRGFLWLSIRHNRSRPRFPPSGPTIAPKLRTIHLTQSFQDPDLRQQLELLTNPACFPALPVIAFRLFVPPQPSEAPLKEAIYTDSSLSYAGDKTTCRVWEV